MGGFEETVEPATEGVVVVDGAGTMVMVNIVAEKVFGYSRGQLLGAPVDRLMAPEDRARLRSALFEESSLWSREFGSRLEGLRQDGHRFPIEVSLSLMATGAGADRLVSAVIRDVSAQRNSERAQLRLASLVDSAQDAIMSADLEGRIDSWNRAAERLFGYSAAEAIGQPATFLKPPTLLGKSGDRLARLRGGAAVPPIDTIRRTKAGRDIEVSITHSAIQDPQGNLIGTSIVARDLTNQRKSEAARFHLAAIIEHSGAAIIGTDLDARITSWNAAAEKLYGYPVADVIGRPRSFLVRPGEQDEAVYAQLQRGETVPPYDAVRRRQDGTSLDVSISPSIIRDAADTIVGYSELGYDITERKQTERALEAAHEATLVASHEYESFAYAVAHNLRTPLRGIGGFIYLGQEQYEAGDSAAARVLMDRARASAGQMGRLIDSLLRLAQVSRRLINCTPVDLSLLATAAIDRLRSEFPNRTVETTVRPGIGTVGDADLLDIVVTSLIDNAWKFTRPNPAARIEFGCESDQFVVSDNGVGFDMAHYDKLFGLCQRLHHESEFEGSGIGLATSQRIIRRHGGRIWAESVVGQGSTFRFTIPPMRNERA